MPSISELVWPSLSIWYLFGYVLEKKKPAKMQEIYVIMSIVVDLPEFSVQTI